MRCSEASDSVMSAIGCFIYDFQTLLTGAAAILVAIIAGVPVWRQLKDTNLQTRISHRETLGALLRDALARYAQVDQAIRAPLSDAQRSTSDPIGEPEEIGPEAAHHLENRFGGMLSWYLVVQADTEHSDIEAEKAKLKEALEKLVRTLGEAHWADHNEQHDEDHSFTDGEWANVLARCAAAKLEAYERVADVSAAYRVLVEAQQKWVRSLRLQIAKLDRQIVNAG